MRLITTLCLGLLTMDAVVWTRVAGYQAGLVWLGIAVVVGIVDGLDNLNQKEGE
jgi:hypothetical protein